MCILGLLAVVLIPNFSGYLKRAGEVSCIANMRSINVALRSYLLDHQDIWPQGPTMMEEEAWEAFWLEALEPYGITEETWQCPTVDSSLAEQGAKKEDRPKLHYIPTVFSAERGIAYRWSQQPWLIERASAHGEGPLICFPDGSIKSFHKVLAEQGVR